MLDASMNRRRVPRAIVALVLLYLALDLCNPLPGAFSFNPDQCIDGVRAEPLRDEIPTPTVLVLPTQARVEPPPPTRPVVRTIPSVPRFISRALPFRYAPPGASPGQSPEDH